MANKQKPTTFRRLAQEAKPIARWLLLGAFVDMLAVLCAAATPKLLGALVQRICDAWESGAAAGLSRGLLPGILLLLALYALGTAMNGCNIVIMNHFVSRHFTHNLRVRVSEKITRLGVSFVDQTPVGDVLNRMVDDVGEMGGYVHQIFDILVKGLFQLILIVVLMLFEDWRLALLVMAATPLSLLLSSRIAAVSEKRYDEMFAQSGSLAEIVEEAFSNLTTTKAYNLEAYQQEKYEKINQKLKQTSARAEYLASIVQPLIALSNSLAYVLITLVGGYLIVQNGLPVGTVVTILLFAQQFASPLEQFASGFSQINRVKAASARVFELLDQPEEARQQGTLPGAPRGRVEFAHVDFSYRADEPLICDMNLVAQPGQRIAIVGPTGAGKTTLVNLLMRFYDPDAGRILLDGTDIGTLSRDAVRACFGMVLQDTWLFRGTIAENIAYGKPDASRTEIEDACRKAYCDRFIRTMPKGYETVIGEDTVNLSGGQKQMLTIARALLADRPLLILDEATSNVDTRTELLIQNAMERLMAGKTCFVIAHRLSTIVNADTILVVDQGKIVEQGNHRALLARRGFYYRLYTSQYAR